MRGAHDQLLGERLGDRHAQRLAVEIRLKARCGRRAERRSAACELRRSPSARILRVVSISAAAGRADRARQRGTGQQDHRGEQQEQHEDVDAEAAHEPMSRLVEGLADHPAVALQSARISRPRAVSGGTGADAERAGGQGEREGGEQTDDARAQRPDGREHGTQQQQPPCGDEGHGRQHPGSAEHPAQCHGESVPGASPVPAAVQDEPHEHADGRQAQAEHIAPALVEHAACSTAAPRPSARSPGARGRCGGGGRGRALLLAAGVRVLPRFRVAGIQRNFDASPP